MVKRLTLEAYSKKKGPREGVSESGNSTRRTNLFPERMDPLQIQEA